MSNPKVIFARNGKTFRQLPSNDLVPALPPGNYNIKKDLSGLFFESMEPFELPKKCYGVNDNHAERILATFASRKAATGVLLAGEKGSGKSLLAKTICIQAAVKGMPTIVINQPWTGDGFNQMIQDVAQPAIVLFDEFEKVYDRTQQEEVLTLLDGVYPSQKLYVFTCNDKYRIDSHMRNRPGRIFYALDFRGIGPDFIREYCTDNLNDMGEIESIIKIGALFKEFNFDMLKALVEEMNRFEEPALVAVQMLNIKPEFDGGSTYTITLKHATREVTRLYTPTFEGNPLLQKFNVDYYYKAPEKDDPDNVDYASIILSPAELVEMNPEDGAMFFKTEEAEVCLKRKPIKTYDSMRFL